MQNSNKYIYTECFSFLYLYLCRIMCRKNVIYCDSELTTYILYYYNFLRILRNHSHDLASRYEMLENQFLNNDLYFTQLNVHIIIQYFNLILGLPGFQIENSFGVVFRPHTYSGCQRLWKEKKILVDPSCVTIISRARQFFNFK